LGGSGGEKAFTRGTNHENAVFGLADSNFLNGVPKLKFEHFVTFTLSTDAENGTAQPATSDKVSRFPTVPNVERMAALVKTVDYPSMSIDTQTINQYNKKRIVQKKIEYDKITMVLHDVADGRTLELWKRYYNYYYKDGADNIRASLLTTPGSNSTELPPATTIGTEDADPTFYKNYGLRPVNMPFFESIELYYIHGKTYDKVTLIKPKVTDFKHDAINYEDMSGMMSLTFTIEYESVIYGDVLPAAKGLTSSIEDVIGKPTLNRSGDNGNPTIKSKHVVYGKGSATGLSASESSTSGKSDPFGLQKALGGILGNIAGDVKSSIVRGIKTGNFSLQPNPLKSARNVIGNIGNNIKGNAIQSFTNTAVNAVSSVFTTKKTEEDANNKDQSTGTGGGGHG